ncbi:MAG: RecQ family ATP-dependent DNA helicase [Candidatus Poribacteria bacterium]|nr:RecQ family ATP-dependent DNA helicase [Candidatus Poribacteria bacterium]
MERARELLVETFGFDQFLPGQAEVIAHLLAGRSALAIFPTGGGKSLCYQLPALTFDGVTIVISPLIALMKDQIDVLKSRGVPAERLDSTLSADETRAVMSALRSGELRLLYVAPERFSNERFLQAILHTRVSMFAIDEAHCISEWGHNFRPDYLKLARFAQACRAERLFALTATATPKVAEDICSGFGIDPECEIRTGFYRPNLTVLTTPITAADRDEALLERLKDHPAGPTIVYVTRQKTSEQVAAHLAKAGLPAQAYHAGMKDDKRAEVQDWFMASNDGIVVATIAFGMGIDKSDIRYIYHYNLPKSLENFSQEIGRAGRDGRTSICEMFICHNDICPLENFAYGDTPGRNAIRGLLEELFSFSGEFDVGIHELSARHDIRHLVTRTLLVQLELENYLQELTPFYSRYQFQPLVSSSEILSQFEGERRRFLADVFRQAEKARIWFSIDLDKAATAINCPRDRIVRALDYLAEKSLLEVRAEGVRNRFTMLRRPEGIEHLIDVLFQNALEREAREIARIGQALELAAHNGCQVMSLAAHFGEELPRACGHCSWCLNGHQPATLVPREPAAIDPNLWQRMLDAWHDQAEPIDDARALARFACGITSPRLTRTGLSRHPLFGCLAHVSFGDVHKRAQSAEVH